ncbi:hypothetical protein FDU21_07445 [Xanthomonas oryzae pv. oryzae]|nr:hypothetical protein FDU21_07445 [Xanthomonas oryzae pv. oryzae]
MDTSKNGRTDAIFGEIFFKLPSTTQVYAQRPALNQTAGAGGTALGEELFVESATRQAMPRSLHTKLTERRLAMC